MGKLSHDVSWHSRGTANQQSRVSSCRWSKLVRISFIAFYLPLNMMESHLGLRLTCTVRLILQLRSHEDIPVFSNTIDPISFWRDARTNKISTFSLTRWQTLHHLPTKIIKVQISQCHYKSSNSMVMQDWALNKLWAIRKYAALWRERVLEHVLNQERTRGPGLARSSHRWMMLDYRQQCAPCF